MKLGVFFRETLEGVSAILVQELDRAYSVIRATWNIEHKSNGAHGHVTASSVTADRVLVGSATPDDSSVPLHIDSADFQQPVIVESQKTGATDGAYIGFTDHTGGVEHSNVLVGSVDGNLVLNAAGGNVGIGTTDPHALLSVGGGAARGTTEGTNRIDIFDGTAPVGTLTNGVSLYSSGGKLFAMDAAGTATQLTP